MAVIALPLLAACGGETPTATSIPAAATNTGAPAASATNNTAASAATNTTAAAAATNTAPADAAATPTAAAMAGTTAAAVSASGSALDQLAAEGGKPDPAASGNFEFFCWWTAGGEAEGKNDIRNLFKQLYSGVKVIDAAVAGGGGDQAKAVLKTRIQGN